jgi:hypothetical protein
MCQDVDAGMAAGFPENRCRVFMSGFCLFWGEVSDRRKDLFAGILLLKPPGFEEASGDSSAPWIP